MMSIRAPFAFLAPALALATLAAVSFGPGAARADAAELAGVEMADRSSVGDAELVLNGLALRKRFIVKVYVAGLYLPKKTTDAAAILEADEPRRLVMEFLRDVDGESIAGGWNDCLENNSPNASADVEAGFAQLNRWMTAVEKGDRIRFTYQPGTGTEVAVGGDAQGTIEGKSFADALFACWVGEVPPSDDFKEGLLGG